MPSNIESVNNMREVPMIYMLGGCPRIEAVAREGGFESDFSMI